MPDVSTATCPVCREPLAPDERPRGKPRRFCSEAHRRAWGRMLARIAREADRMISEVQQ